MEVIMTPQIHLSTLFVPLHPKVSSPVLSPRRQSWVTLMAQNRHQRSAPPRQRGRKIPEGEKKNEVNNLRDGFKIKERLQHSQQAFSRAAAIMLYKTTPNT